MSKLNTKRPPIHTYEGAKAQHLNLRQQLRRSVMSCLLWEREFYEDGETIVDRLRSLVPKVEASKVAKIAVEARISMKLRHIPLLLAREMARYDPHKSYVADTLVCIIQRPDDLTEFLALYWKDGKEPLSAQVKKGLARAFTKFDEYSLAKYNRPSKIKLRDVLFLCHARPKNAEQEALWKRLVNNELKIPDTWEVALSAKDDISKKEKWERLLREDRLGALALLRNLRNMTQEAVSGDLIRDALVRMSVSRLLPFRFIAAARFVPSLEPVLERKMFDCVAELPKLFGKTVVLLDVSGSMVWKLSAKSTMTRSDVANGLGILLREVCEGVRVFSFSDDLIEVPARRGFALRDAIGRSQPHSGTYLGKALQTLAQLVQTEKLSLDRLIVLTDEQSYDTVPAPPKGVKAYMVNIASAVNGVGYGAWTHIDGWSEAIIRYIQEFEQ